VKILLDENVPVQAQPVLERTLRGHDVAHVQGVQWKGKRDEFLLPDAAKRGYHVFVTKDNNQLNDPDQTSLIRKSKLHHVRFDQGNRGVSDYARAVGCLVAAMYDVMEELQAADGQRLVKITKLDASKRRHETINPKTDPPAYWRSSPSRKPRRVK
jgi:predicted nuclease of predicted toxin-antitoxin system